MRMYLASLGCKMLLVHLLTAAPANKKATSAQRTRPQHGTACRSCNGSFCLGHACPCCGWCYLSKSVSRNGMLQERAGGAAGSGCAGPMKVGGPLPAPPVEVIQREAEKREAKKREREAKRREAKKRKRQSKTNEEHLYLPQASRAQPCQSVRLATDLQ